MSTEMPVDAPRIWDTADSPLDSNEESPSREEGLLHRVQREIERFIALPSGGGAAIALWVVHTHCSEAFDIRPRLAILSPEKRSGKTLTLSVLNALVARPLTTSNITTAAVFRSIEKWRPTLLIDEADTFLGNREELLGILNAGHRHDGKVVRCVGEQYEPKQFNASCPAAIAQIGDLPETLMDRSIVIRLQRRTRDEVIERWTKQESTRLQSLKQEIAAWAAEHQEQLARLEPELPELGNDRAADNWLPLLAIAEAAGGDWPERARDAAVLLTRPDDVESTGTQLLSDIRLLLAEYRENRIATDDLLSGLLHMRDRPWSAWFHGRPMTPSQLAKRLAPYGIKPRQIRFGLETRRGYFKEDFNEAFRRYLPEPVQEVEMA